MGFSFDPFGLVRFDFGKKSLDGKPVHEGPRATMIKYAILFPAVTPLPVMACWESCEVFISLFPFFHTLFLAVYVGLYWGILIYLLEVGLFYVAFSTLSDRLKKYSSQHLWIFLLIVGVSLVAVIDGLYLVFRPLIV